MNSLQLNGQALSVYENVFKPLSEPLEAIREVKRSAPDRRAYVKLRTQNEENPEEIRAVVNLIDQSGRFSLLQGAYVGSWNFVSNTLNDSGVGPWLKRWSWDYIDLPNCSRTHTETALRTALSVFRSGIQEFHQALEGLNSLESLESFKSQLAEIKETVERAKKTVCYVYRTYDQKAEDESEELQEQGGGPQGIYDQYAALCDMLTKDFPSLEQAISGKMELLSCSPDVSELRESSLSSSLQFDSPEKASLWFCKQRKIHQERVCRNHSRVWDYSIEFLSRIGDETFHDLEKTARIVGEVPETFVDFAKTMDEALAKIYKGNKIRSSQFVRELYELSRKELAKKGLDMPISSRPDHFKMWFKELCLKGASREIYQAIFTALLNPEGNGPYRLDSAPSVLNAIMVSNYFSMFEIEVF